jgi:hypothetical protein
MTAVDVENNLMTALPVKVEKITVTTSVAGAAATRSTNKVSGQILEVAFDKGDVGAATTAVVTGYTALATSSVLKAIDSYNVNTASAFRLVALAAPVYINDYILVTVTGGDTSKTFIVYIYYR